MPPTQHQIQIITNPSDLTAWTAAQYASFVGTSNVAHDILFPPSTPPTPSQLNVSIQRHIQSLQADPEHTFYIQIVDPTNNNKIMGGAKWQLWERDPQRPAKVEVTFIDDSSEQGRAEREFAQHLMDDFQGSRARNMAMPHGLLDICFTTPEYERRGVASALVKWGLERCDKEGWPAFTEASLRGSPVYARLGFESREIVRLRYDELGDYAKGIGDVYWDFMVRPARKKD